MPMSFMPKSCAWFCIPPCGSIGLVRPSKSSSSPNTAEPVEKVAGAAPGKLFENGDCMLPDIARSFGSIPPGPFIWKPCCAILAKRTILCALHWQREVGYITEVRLWLPDQGVVLVYGLDLGRSDVVGQVKWVGRPMRGGGRYVSPSPTQPRIGVTACKITDVGRGCAAWRPDTPK